VTAHDGWRLEPHGDLVLLRCAALAGIPSVAHAFSTRRSDAGDFDLGGAEHAPIPAVALRRSRFLAAAGFAAANATVLRQVHGDTVVHARAAGVPTDADGAFWLSSDGLAGLPSVRSADCVPVLIAARDGSAVAAVHAGWRGTAAAIAARAVELLAERGIAPGTLVAAIGPAIGPCCYPVGREVFEAVLRTPPGPAAAAEETPAGLRLDLKDVNRRQLAAAGVPWEHVHVCPECTSCRPDLFFSYRRDGAGTGRMLAAVGLAGPAGPRP